MSDIKVKEKSIEAMMKGKLVYEPPRFMTASQAASQIVDCFKMESNTIGVTGDSNIEHSFSPNSFCIGLARVGSDDQTIIRCKLSEMVDKDLGKPLHSLVIEGNLHPLEEDMLKLYTAE